MGLGNLIFSGLQLYFGGRAVLSGLRGLRELSTQEKTQLASVALDVARSRSARGGKGLGAPKLTLRKVHSLDDRIRYIKEMIRKGTTDGEFRVLVAKVLGRKCGTEWCVPERNAEAEVNAIFDFLRRRLRYTRDIHGIDTYQSPQRTLQLGISDCDDASIVLAALLQSAGYPVKLRVIQTIKAPDWDHIYVLVGLPPGNPEEWMPLDLTVKQPAGWEAPRSMVKRVRDFTV